MYLAICTEILRHATIKHPRSLAVITYKLNLLETQTIPYNSKVSMSLFSYSRGMHRMGMKFVYRIVASAFILCFRWIADENGFQPIVSRNPSK